MHLPQKFLVGEPDEVGEVSGDKFVGVGDLEGELGSCRGVGESVGDRIESAGLAELPGGLAEIFLVNRGSEGKAAGGCHLPGGEAFASRHFDVDQLAIGGRDRGGSLSTSKTREAEKSRVDGKDTLREGRFH